MCRCEHVWKMNVKGPLQRLIGGLEGWEGGGAHPCVCVCIILRCVNVKRWIAMETRCKPVGKQSNYDVLGSKVRAVFRTGPLAIRYSSILHGITWPITLCVTEWFIALKLDLVWKTVGNDTLIVLCVRLSLEADTPSAHILVCWGKTACNMGAHM